MKKLLILGSSLGASEIVQKARKRGWYTIVTDNLPPEKSPAKQVADACWMISTADTGTLEEMCRKEGVSAIFSGVSEFNLDRVLTLTQALKLPCYISESVWTIARNKRLFKKKCMEKGIPVIPEYPVPAADDEAAWERITYPVVVKPVDGAGNAGLSICRNRQELSEGIRKARAFNPAKPEIIIEQYIAGEETLNYYLIAEGNIHYVYSGRALREPGYPTFLYSYATFAVRGIDDYLEKLHPQFLSLLQDIGCREGIAWLQCIRDEEGNYHALEMAHRMSADISGDILERSLGFNNVDWMLDTALGIRHSEEMIPKKVIPPYPAVMCVYFLFADHAGRIEKMTGFNKLDPDRFHVEALNAPGDDIGQYKLMAKVAFFARQTEEIIHIMQYLNQSIVILDTDGRDLVVRYTDYETVRLCHEGLL